MKPCKTCGAPLEYKEYQLTMDTYRYRECINGHMEMLLSYGDILWILLISMAILSLLLAFLHTIKHETL